MASNSFGKIFKITTWGESHGRAIGVVIDGCPAGIKISAHDINLALEKRAPGKNKYTSPRIEPDLADIYSGVFNGVTTAAPISIIIENKDADSSKYEPIKDLLRPGHANYTYMEKYGVFDYRGGGRASARETACRVAAGAVAQKILDKYEIQVLAKLYSVGDAKTDSSQKSLITKLQEQGDSIGGVVKFSISNSFVGLGDPIYEKLEANLAKAMMSMPASKGFEIGMGFNAAKMQGSEHNDLFINNKDNINSSNNSGGILGGISNGMDIVGKVSFKPTSSIKISQDTVDYDGNKQVFNLPEGSRHDPCVAIRAVPVVKAMCQLVLADAILMNYKVKI